MGSKFYIYCTVHWNPYWILSWERESEYWQELGNFLIRRHFWDSLWWGLRALQGAIRISQRASQGNHVKVTCKSWRQFVSPRQINISLSWWNLENYAPKWSSFLQSAKSTWSRHKQWNLGTKEGVIFRHIEILKRFRRILSKIVGDELVKSWRMWW